MKRAILLAAMLALTPCTATNAAAASSAACVRPVRIESRLSAASALGAGWWERNKARFQELAVCALASADMTVAFIAGVSGAGGVLGVAAAAVTVAMCL